MQALDDVTRSGPDFASLSAMFGDGLTFVRDGNRAQWSLNGRSAIVRLLPGGTVDATFVERPMSESVSASWGAPVYRGETTGYRLATGGCSRMVSDIVAFFAGVREPRFTFAGIRASEAVPQ